MWVLVWVTFLSVTACVNICEGAGLGMCLCGGWFEYMFVWVLVLVSICVGSGVVVCLHGCLLVFVFVFVLEWV